GRARPARDLALGVAGARDVFEFVVVFEIDLVEPVRLGAAAREITPAGEWLARRPAIGATGEAAELVRRGLCCDRLAELKVPERGAPQLLRGGRNQGRQEHGYAQDRPDRLSCMGE